MRIPTVVCATLVMLGGASNHAEPVNRRAPSMLSAGPCGVMEAPRVRQELEKWYADNRQAFLAEDFGAIMALRTADSHAVTPDGTDHDRGEMEQATRGLLEAVDRWIDQSFDIDSLELSDGEARAMVRQHVVRMARRSDGLIHHVETWVTQRESFRCTPDGWKLHQVDGIHDQRRLIDGQPG